MNDAAYITITYDKYEPCIEAQITRDFLSMQMACPNTQFYCVAPNDFPRLALSALGIDLVSQSDQSHTLIQYKVGKHYAKKPKMPVNTTIIDRDLHKDLDVGNKLDLGDHPGYYLPELSRPYISDINRLRTPPNNGQIPPNPALLYLWGP